MAAMDANELRELGQQLRVDSIRPAAVAKSGHPTSGMSAADLMAVLVANHLRYDFDAPKNAANDRLVFSKGHASTLYYAILRAAGAITDDELLTYRKFGSMLEGHPTPLIPWVDVATGSLGQGLPIGVGMGLAARYLDRLPTRVWVLCGDSEMAEGSMWEAFEHASHYELEHLTAIIDVNRLGQRGETMIGWNTGVYVARARAFGWNAIEIDGHDVEEIDRAYKEAEETTGRPTVIVALDGEVSNSTFAEIFKQAHPDRFFEMYIAEQQLIAAAVGLHARGWNAFASTFAAFFSRAYDFVRMAAISRVDLRLAGSHAGVSIGEDGPSQMALEDIASLRAIHSSVVLHPCDANQTAKLVVAMADTKGIVFMRTLRPNTPVIYGPDEEFEVGGSRVVRSSDDDDVTIVGTGITVHEALKAAGALAEDGVTARVIDAYSIKPIDGDALQAAAEATGKIVTVEDHFPEGGLGDAVLAALAERDEHPRVLKPAVREMPRSGKPEELLNAYGIDAEHIAAAARQLVGSEVTTS